MAKRSHKVAFDVNELSDLKPVKKDGNKHSLDSDEEDSAAEEEKKNVMHADDIEGEEDGTAGVEGEITITPFNMKEELEEGHFDTQGHYHWKKEKEIKDSWLDNIDWVKVKGRPEDKYKVHKDDAMKGLGDESSSDSEDEDEKKFDLIYNYTEMLKLMQPKETVAKALQRLGGKKSYVSTAERWKRKKAGIEETPTSSSVTRLTELANEILTQMGNMDVYQETYDMIESIINKKSGQSSKNSGKSEELDMYADDFDEKEKTKFTADNKNLEDDAEEKTLTWEFKWSQEDAADVHGPHTTRQMQKWHSDGYFKTGVWVRKCGEQGTFYTSNRIDFEIYL